MNQQSLGLRKTYLQKNEITGKVGYKRIVILIRLLGDLLFTIFR